VGDLTFEPGVDQANHFRPPCFASMRDSQNATIALKIE
jgi:hypothetical protein